MFTLQHLAEIIDDYNAKGIDLTTVEVVTAGDTTRLVREEPLRLVLDNENPYTEQESDADNSILYYSDEE